MKISAKTSQIEYSKRRHATFVASARGTKTRGFTLIELMIVIAIAAIISGLLIGGFFKISQSNRRSGCQVNLSQIYNALRLYTQDYDGQYPFYNDTVANDGLAVPNSTDPIVDTMGLWRLYTTQAPDDVIDVGSDDLDFKLYNTINSDPDSTKKPVGVYLRNLTNLHCPSDTEHETVFNPSNPNEYDSNYISYQVSDNGVPTYQTQRLLVDGGTTDDDKKRQLMYWFENGTSYDRVIEQQPASDTVILWCKWHRNGSYQLDNVLFADGSVRARPQESRLWSRKP